LTKQEASLCVVAEGCFRPTDEELAKFMEKKHISFVGSKRSHTYEHYEESFIPLLRYSGGYNLPEVLIPFSVRAETVSYGKVLTAIWKLKMWFAKKTGVSVRAQISRTNSYV